MDKPPEEVFKLLNEDGTLNLSSSTEFPELASPSQGGNEASNSQLPYSAQCSGPPCPSFPDSISELDLEVQPS